jgi:hypothetical protein
MISFTDNIVIEKLQFCWNSGNANLNFNLDIIAVVRLAPMTSLQPAYHIKLLSFRIVMGFIALSIILKYMTELSQFV